MASRYVIEIIKLLDLFGHVLDCNNQSIKVKKSMILFLQKLQKGRYGWW